MSLAVARDWYRQRKFSDDITLIWETHVSPHLRCNIWHIHGRERDVLVDSGMGLVSLRCAIPALCERPLLAVCSHSHFDHVGCHHEFEQRLCHPAEAEIMRRPTADNTVWTAFLENVELLLEGEPPMTALPFDGFDLADYHIEPAPPTQLIDEGDELDLGDRLLKVFHMPGHSPGSICLYERATKTLFTGDVVYDGVLIDELYHSDPERYLETLARLKEIPAETFHCGHYGSFGRERMLSVIEQYQRSKSV